MSLTVDQLRVTQTKEAIAARIVAGLATAGLPTSSWAPAASGGLEMSIVEMSAGGLASLITPKLQLLVASRFLDLAAGDWLTWHALKFYKTARQVATYTIQNVALTSVAGAPPYDFAPGELWVSGIGGNKYVNLDQVSIKPGDTKNCRFQAENAGSSYADIGGGITQMVTAPAGLGCKNIPPAAFAPTTLLGSSAGTVTGDFSAYGVPPTFGSIRVRIDTTGAVGVGTCSFSTDGGAWFGGAPIPLNIGILGAALFFDSTGKTYNAGDVFTLIVADCILQRGTDAETDPALRDRCRDRWSTLSSVPTEGLIRLWAHEASPEVTRVRVDADPGTPGTILVTLASASGPASPAAQVAVQQYITPRLFGYKGVPAPTGSPPVGISPEEKATCRSAIKRVITAGGVAQVPAAKMAAVQAEAERLWALYLGGLNLGGIVVAAELVQAVMDAGATNFYDEALNGSLSANVDLADAEVPVEPDGKALSALLTWIPL